MTAKIVTFRGAVRRFIAIEQLGEGLWRPSVYAGGFRLVARFPLQPDSPSIDTAVSDGRSLSKRTGIPFLTNWMVLSLAPVRRSRNRHASRGDGAAS